MAKSKKSFLRMIASIVLTGFIFSNSVSSAPLTSFVIAPEKPSFVKAGNATNSPGVRDELADFASRYSEQKSELRSRSHQSDGHDAGHRARRFLQSRTAVSLGQIVGFGVDPDSAVRLLTEEGFRENGQPGLYARRDNSDNDVEFGDVEGRSELRSESSLVMDGWTYAPHGWSVFGVPPHAFTFEEFEIRVEREDITPGAALLVHAEDGEHALIFSGLQNDHLVGMEGSSEVTIPVTHIRSINISKPESGPTSRSELRRFSPLYQTLLAAGLGFIGLGNLACVTFNTTVNVYLDASLLGDIPLDEDSIAQTYDDIIPIISEFGIQAERLDLFGSGDYLVSKSGNQLAIANKENGMSRILYFSDAKSNRTPVTVTSDKDILEMAFTTDGQLAIASLDATFYVNADGSITEINRSELRTNKLAPKETFEILQLKAGLEGNLISEERGLEWREFVLGNDEITLQQLSRLLQLSGLGESNPVLDNGTILKPRVLVVKKPLVDKTFFVGLLFFDKTTQNYRMIQLKAFGDLPYESILGYIYKKRAHIKMNGYVVTPLAADMELREDRLEFKVFTEARSELRTTKRGAIPHDWQALLAHSHRIIKHKELRTKWRAATAARRTTYALEYELDGLTGLQPEDSAFFKASKNGRSELRFEVSDSAAEIIKDLKNGTPEMQLTALAQIVSFFNVRQKFHRLVKFAKILGVKSTGVDATVLTSIPAIALAQARYDGNQPLVGAGADKTKLDDVKLKLDAEAARVERELYQLVALLSGHNITNVIAEGRRDDIPIGDQLPVGHQAIMKLGGTTIETGNDAVDGTTRTAEGKKGGISVFAHSFRGGFVPLPDTVRINNVIYVGNDAQINLREDMANPEVLWRKIVDANGGNADDFVLFILDSKKRPHHIALVETAKRLGINVIEYPDGSVQPSLLAAALPNILGKKIMVAGRVGASEAALVAAALRGIHHSNGSGNNQVQFAGEIISTNSSYQVETEPVGHIKGIPYYKRTAEKVVGFTGTRYRFTQGEVEDLLKSGFNVEQILKMSEGQFQMGLDQLAKKPGTVLFSPITDLMPDSKEQDVIVWSHDPAVQPKGVRIGEREIEVDTVEVGPNGAYVIKSAYPNVPADQLVQQFRDQIALANALIQTLADSTDRHVKKEVRRVANAIAGKSFSRNLDDLLNDHISAAVDPRSELRSRTGKTDGHSTASEISRVLKKSLEVDVREFMARFSLDEAAAQHQFIAHGFGPDPRREGHFIRTSLKDSDDTFFLRDDEADLHGTQERLVLLDQFIAGLEVVLQQLRSQEPRNGKREAEISETLRQARQTQTELREKVASLKGSSNSELRSELRVVKEIAKLDPAKARLSSIQSQVNQIVSTIQSNHKTPSAQVVNQLEGFLTSGKSIPTGIGNAPVVKSQEATLILPDLTGNFEAIILDVAHAAAEKRMVGVLAADQNHERTLMSQLSVLPAFKDGRVKVINAKNFRNVREFILQNGIKMVFALGLKGELDHGIAWNLASQLREKKVEFRASFFSDARQAAGILGLTEDLFVEQSGRLMQLRAA